MHSATSCNTPASTTCASPLTPPWSISAAASLLTRSPSSASAAHLPMA
jgi:hypothetical protein